MAVFLALVVVFAVGVATGIYLGLVLVVWTYNGRFPPRPSGTSYHDDYHAHLFDRPRKE